MAAAPWRQLLRVVSALLLAITALGLLAFALEGLLAVLERDAPMSWLLAAAVALAISFWCARTSWRLVVGRARSEKD